MRENPFFNLFPSPTTSSLATALRRSPFLPARPPPPLGSSLSSILYVLYIFYPFHRLLSFLSSAASSASSAILCALARDFSCVMKVFSIPCGGIPRKNIRWFLSEVLIFFFDHSYSILVFRDEMNLSGPPSRSSRIVKKMKSSLIFEKYQHPLVFNGVHGRK